MKYPDAGINPAKSGLTARAGLYFNAGLHDKGDGFNLQDLDPYLLFDAETSMLGNLENPTLDLDPATPDTLDVITATRAGIATFTAADGQIVVADENTVRVDHVQGEELTPTVYQLIENTDFSGWVQASYTTLTDGEGYDGQPSKIFEATSGTNRTFRGNTFATTAGTTYVGSFWIRRVSGTGTIYLLHQYSATANITNITSELSEEWTFVERTFLGNASSGDVYFGVWVGAQGDAVEIAMPQVTIGSTARTFVPNTTGSPKFIASATYGPRVPMMLIEPSATNLVPYSEDFSDAFYIKDSGVSIGTTNHQSPSGSLNATKIEVSDNGRLYANTASDTYAASIFIKKGTFANFIVSGNYIDLNAGTATSGTIEQLNDGWYRVSSSKVTTSRPFQIQAYPDATYSVHSESGDFYLWGAQVETGSVATSYIPTSGSAVTRNADYLIIDGTAFSDFYNGSEGTFFVTAQTRNTTDSFTLLGGSNFSQSFFYSNASNDNLYSYDGTNLITYYTPSNNQDFNVALTWNASEMKGARDGTQYPTKASSGNFASASILRIGDPYNGYVRRILFWPTHSDSL